MPNIHTHEEGFFILQFASDPDCNEIPSGGLYFLGRALIIVEK